MMRKRSIRSQLKLNPYRRGLLKRAQNKAHERARQALQEQFNQLYGAVEPRGEVN